jgi:hypothetical protein
VGSFLVRTVVVVRSLHQLVDERGRVCGNTEICGTPPQATQSVDALSDLRQGARRYRFVQGDVPVLQACADGGQGRLEPLDAKLFGIGLTDEGAALSREPERMQR